MQRLVSQAQEQQAQAEDLAAGRDGRGRPGGAGQIGRDKAGRSKITLELGADLQEQLRQAAATEDCSISDVAEAAIRAFLAEWDAGRVDLHPFKTPARSLKALWKLELPGDYRPFSD